MVEIELYVSEDPRPSMAVMMRGGIKLHVDGDRLNRYSNEQNRNWLQDWQPEYSGEHVMLDLQGFLECALAVRAGDRPLFDAHVVQLHETTDVFVVEQVSKSHVRLAFQKKAGSSSESTLPAVDVAVGHAVPIDEFVAEVLQSGESLADAATRFGLDDDRDFRQFFETLEDLREVEARRT